MLNRLADAAETLREPIIDLSVAMGDALLSSPIDPTWNAITEWAEPCRERLDDLLHAIDLLGELADYLDTLTPTLE